MMHVLDYQRALGELLELDDTIRASIEHLKKIGEYDDTLIVITADHGHGFDVLYASPPPFPFRSRPLMARASPQRRRRLCPGLAASPDPPGAGPAHPQVRAGAVRLPGP